MLFLDIVVRILVWLCLAPLLPGIINRVKAWVACRQGPPVLQLYYDLWRLWHKKVVMSDLASPGFLIAPAVAWMTTIFAAMLLPLGPAGCLVSFDGDIILFIYLLALGRFCLAWGAMETGSAFEGMGTAREVSFAVLAEVGIMTAVLTLVLQSGQTRLEALFAPLSGPAAILLAVGLFILLLAENCRVPFDDPCTHLELTMIHEVMVLDHSGPPFALILHGASVKLALFAAFLVQAVLPLDTFSWSASMGVLALGIVLTVIVVGLVESLTARLAFRRTPLLLTIGFLFCLFPLILTWMGGLHD